MSNVLKVWGSPRVRSWRARVAALGAAVVVVGGVACSGAGSFNQPAAAPTSAPAAAVRSGQPAAVPAAQGAAGGAAVLAAAPAPAPASAASDAAAKTASQQPDAVVDSSAQILNRMVIRNAQLSVEVGDIDQ